MKQPLILILIFFTSYCYTQEIKFGCLLLDFENAPELGLSEGSPLSDQFEAEFGLSFSLEDGTFPVLAQVGNPGTAFFRNDGQGDTPAATDAETVGQFFLTDDGTLSQTASPLILDFSTPIDSFAGCILDMDGNEVFKIEAFDQMGATILEDSIQAGDTGTGDGLATCWGFNLDGCVGTVYQIKFSGFRTDGGGFGLGLDNFSFCYSGINVDVDDRQPTCLALDGSFKIFSTTSEIYEYSLDGVNFDLNGEFFDLSPDVYTVFVRDENGCETTVPVVITAAEDPLFVEVDVTNTRCDENNGMVDFDVTPDINANFTIDGGITFSNENFFDNLAPGEYIIQAVDDNGCTGQLDFEILPSTLLELEIASTFSETCDGNDGSVLGASTNGTAPYSYSINDGPFQSDATFEGLPGGEYEMVSIDDQGCENRASFTIEPYPFIILGNFPIKEPECILENGEIQINASGGFGSLSYSLDSVNFQNDTLFTNLKPGDYTIIIRDENDCQIDTTLSLAIPLCPIYVPNIISPNGDGVNEEFIISVHPNYDVDILRYWIFDRWGERIFYSENFSIHEFRIDTQVDKIWWDGRFKGDDAVEGVYAYLIEVQHENGDKGFLSGDVTLVR